MYTKDCAFSLKEVERHLGKIKYSEVRLVDSSFYKDYIALRQVSFGKERASLDYVERVRLSIHEKAEKLNIPEPENWQNEFLICSEKIG